MREKLGFALGAIGLIIGTIWLSGPDTSFGGTMIALGAGALCLVGQWLARGGKPAANAIKPRARQEP